MIGAVILWFQDILFKIWLWIQDNHFECIFARTILLYRHELQKSNLCLDQSLQSTYWHYDELFMIP